MKVDQLEIKIFETRQEMGENAARMVADKIREIQDTKDFVNIIFASAPSQNEFLEALKAEQGVAWEKSQCVSYGRVRGRSGGCASEFRLFLKSTSVRSCTGAFSFIPRR
jgi:glucosamine-6-phosphate deaminase